MNVWFSLSYGDWMAAKKPKSKTLVSGELMVVQRVGRGYMGTGIVVLQLHDTVVTWPLGSDCRQYIIDQ
ncbi:hypothetical protein H310_14941 [Aphanomyces invadans]|uniref:Uncharacterized protein n=1 Tax=Aphanomyces invadans TaxID=157072 RepID=A0A024T8E0_9STRA|nr:hypothetical protein H310_14941 [Aphanomyces invadans]ETV90229.1 hypothetical protein H310_14941 [Aphanomyces invadans]|eukprot:XP_008881140.1 hypothetical protein H310_14941 [Aphanomyces invadans]